jgi:hypothetical protein
MWEAFGERTITCLARGTRYLAKIWQGAWTAGNGDQNLVIEACREEDILAIYNDPKEMPSVPLDQYPNNPMSDWSTVAYKASTSTPAAAPSSKRTSRRVVKKAPAKKTAAKTATAKKSGARGKPAKKGAPKKTKLKHPPAIGRKANGRADRQPHG